MHHKVLHTTSEAKGLSTSANDFSLMFSTSAIIHALIPGHRFPALSKSSFIKLVHGVIAQPHDWTDIPQNVSDI